MKEINLILPAQASKMGGDLGAILGQHGVNIMKFCKEFNTISVVYEYNLIIRVLLVLKDSSNFKIKLLGPVSSYLIKSLSNEKKEINLLNLYKIILIKKVHNKSMTDKSIFNSIKSTIYSMRYVLKYE